MTFLFEHLAAGLAGIVALIVVIVSAVMTGRKIGRDAAEIGALQKDNQNAEKLRTRLDDDRADRLRKNDDAGYRD